MDSCGPLLATHFLLEKQVEAVSAALLNGTDPSLSPTVVDPFHGRRSVGQALATKAIAECIRSGGAWEAESKIDLLDLASLTRCGKSRSFLRPMISRLR